jgi:hypothetical protein
MSKAVKKHLTLCCAIGTAIVLTMCCAPSPKIQDEPVPDVGPDLTPEPGFVIKPYHRSMLEEMKKSFEVADEIIIGVYTGNYVDEDQGRAFYFDNFRHFEKTTLAWGPLEEILLPVHFEDPKPEIITNAEFKKLSKLDKVGICWDNLDQIRFVYLVEGEQNLVFLKRIVDEANNSYYRVLLDTYPVTKDCNAKDVFDIMIMDFFTLKHSQLRKGGNREWD